MTVPQHLCLQPFLPSDVSFTRLVILNPLTRSFHTVWMFDLIIDVTYNTGRTWRVVYPHPVGTVVRVKVLATVFVESSAAHCDEGQSIGSEKGKVRRNSSRLMDKGTSC